MIREPIESSYLASVGYDPANQRLEVQFRDGVVVVYDNVPTGLYTRMMGAPSVGSFFARNIRKQFPHNSVSS